MKVGSFALSLVMVRLLAPHDFGLYAVALAANAFLIHVNDMGMIAATVQWRGEVEEMAATATDDGHRLQPRLVRAVLGRRPYPRDAAGSPDATPLIRLLTFAIVLDGITAVSVGVIQRRFQQDKLMKAIAVGLRLQRVVTLTLAWPAPAPTASSSARSSRPWWSPSSVLRTARLPFRLGLDRTVARRLLVFGIPLAAGLGVESVVLYSDSVIVGHVLGTVVLGFYLWPSTSPAGFPAWSELPFDTSRSRHSRGSPKARPRRSPSVSNAHCRCWSPSCARSRQDGDAVTCADPVLYGAHWVPAADALRFLAFVMVARMLTALVFDIQTGLGNTKVTVGLNLVWLVALLPALWIGAHHGGIRGAAIGHAIVALVVAIPLAGWLLHRAGVHMGPVLRGIVRPVLAASLPGSRWPRSPG